jgi:hypothetical protein
MTVAAKPATAKAEKLKSKGAKDNFLCPLTNASGSLCFAHGKEA